MAIKLKTPPGPVCSFEVRVRRAVPDDIPQLVEFNRQLVAETGRGSRDLEMNADGIRSLMDQPNLGFYLIAERDCEGDIVQPVGALMVTIEFSDWSNGAFWWIQNIYVRREVRRTGVYRLMFDTVRNMSEGGGRIVGFRVKIRKQNHMAIRAAEAMGMKQNEYVLYELPNEPNVL